MGKNIAGSSQAEEPTMISARVPIRSEYLEKRKRRLMAVNKGVKKRTWPI
jgi:hypothetical protein